MEKGGSRRSGFSISDNKSPPNSDDSNSLKKLHSAEVFPSKIRLMGIHSMDRRFDDGGSGGGGGPTDGSNSGGANEVVGHMLYYDNVSSPRLAVENFSTTNSQQPFDIFASPYSTTHKSPERTMAASGAFPFTSAQWKELERQAMIYKYMMSSLPVPPHLLFPLPRNFPASPLDSSLSSIYNVRYSKNGDPEPGRCKRTDGKKWRCSRDVAPHQKYCERHLHRGRPRSRKPVELINIHSQNSNKKTRLDQTSLPHSTASQQLHFDPKTDLDISSAPCYRDLSLMDGTEKQWQSWAQSNMRFANEGCSIYSSSSLTHQNYVQENPLNMLSYSNFPAVNIEAPTCFINAYSSNNVSVDSTKPENLFPSLNLSIAMASGSLSDQESARVNCCDEQSLKDSRWLGQVSGEPFGRGGPLAEALGCKNRASTHNSISPVATTVSSPTGVLHRTLFSHSDASSVCNSPTFAAPSSEVAFRWLN